MRQAGAAAQGSQPRLFTMKKTSFMRYARVHAIIKQDPALSKKLSQNLVAICRPNQSSCDFPAEVVHVTDEIHRLDLDAYTLSKIEVIRFAHRLLIANSPALTPAPKPMNEPSCTSVADFVLNRRKALETMISDFDKEIKELTKDINRCRSKIKTCRLAAARRLSELEECDSIAEMLKLTKPALIPSLSPSPLSRSRRFELCVLKLLEDKQECDIATIVQHCAEKDESVSTIMSWMYNLNAVKKLKYHRGRACRLGHELSPQKITANHAQHILEFNAFVLKHVLGHPLNAAHIAARWNAQARWKEIEKISVYTCRTRLYRMQREKLVKIVDGMASLPVSEPLELPLPVPVVVDISKQEIASPGLPAAPVIETAAPVIEAAAKPRLTPQSAFYVPLLEVLVSLGGTGKLSEVIEQVGLRMPQLTPADRQRLKTHPVRWKNAVCWARNALKVKGLIKDNSPRGIWEITENGRQWLQNQPSS